MRRRITSDAGDAIRADLAEGHSTKIRLKSVNRFSRTSSVNDVMQKEECLQGHAKLPVQDRRHHIDDDVVNHQPPTGPARTIPQILWECTSQQWRGV
ncbi:hypothetical protein EVAR_79219_1 [Eumeta japonica]|uniref:Uncharacterized protein n=1 Tax=Eumeta variegata TaxID=151549 RepID=A0A4C1UTX4_EUMVA|nr:hypothetical protein EVAR_79219_1 [Eumeta japonica]